MEVQEVIHRLNDNGFPSGTWVTVGGWVKGEAVSQFQRACNMGAPLTVDGIAGPVTQVALAQLPLLSPHFASSELRQHNGGPCYVRRELLEALERLRSTMGKPLPIVDAYRGPDYNKEIGGATNSMHMFGMAADIPHSVGLTVGFVQGLRVFSGIGDRAGIVEHVDVRHLAGSANQTPSATPQNPARWHY